MDSTRAIRAAAAAALLLLGVTGHCGFAIAQSTSIEATPYPSTLAQPAPPPVNATQIPDTVPAAAAAATTRSSAGIKRTTKPRSGAPSSTRAAPSNLGIALGLPATAAAAAGGTGNDTSNAVRIVLGLTLLAIVPSMLVCITAFLRIIIVLSMLRHAIGMPETPPNTALIGLAIFLTMFTMAPMLQTLNRDALQPFLQGQIGNEAAYAKASQPLREFMGRQTREQDIALMIDLSKAPRPESIDDVSNIQLIPAFMLSELRAAFQIGFVIFLPFLLIDLIVSSVLMALGMMMLPPITIALPLKLLMFILVDGWSLILKALVGSFH